MFSGPAAPAPLTVVTPSAHAEGGLLPLVAAAVAVLVCVLIACAALQLAARRREARLQDALARERDAAARRAQALGEDLAVTRAQLARLQDERDANGAEFTRLQAELRAELAARIGVDDRLRTIQKRLDITLASIAEAVIVTDTAQRITEINGAAEALTGWTRAEAIGHALSTVAVLAPDRSIGGQEEMETGEDQALRGHGGRWVLFGRHGVPVPIARTVVPLEGENGRGAGHVVVLRDITATREAADRLAWLARHDALTGLPNRMLLGEWIRRAMEQARRDGTRCALLFCDLDNFKSTNDTFGHERGDELLKKVAQRLSRAVRHGDVVSRQGGDEFMVLLRGLASVDDAQLTAERLLAAMAEPFALGEDTVTLTASIGLSVYPDHGESPEELARQADLAMYRVKHDGRNGVRPFTAEMEQAAAERTRLEQGLRVALSRGEFELHYQPKFSVVDRDVTGAEALLRWRSPALGIVSPAVFIPVAEETGLIVPIGAWVIREALAQQRRWSAAGGRSLPIAVNISFEQVSRAGARTEILSLLDALAIQPGELEFEVTESMAMVDQADVMAWLQALRERGVSLAIDDFGTGYSSLSYLKRLPVDTVKIDRSFIRDVPGDQESAAIVRAITSMTHSLGLNVVAEGVETDAQLAFLAAWGVDQAQGYLLGPPKPAGQVPSLAALSGRLAKTSASAARAHAAQGEQAATPADAAAPTLSAD